MKSNRKRTRLRKVKIDLKELEKKMKMN